MCLRSHNNINYDNIIYSRKYISVGEIGIYVDVTKNGKPRVQSLKNGELLHWDWTAMKVIAEEEMTLRNASVTPLL